ncbi:MAG: hypothetical protein JWP29_5367 [Rhodoferax sp.]|nr:hypothetical protein [Rhodoferax sp.]
MTTPPSPLQPGAKATVTQAVGEPQLAAAFAVDADETYPRVLATPAMVALLERACARLLAPLLGPDQLSVGAAVDVTHLAPTALHEVVTAEAIFRSQAGPLYWFDVTVRDAAGLVGQGRHARAIVSATMVAVKAEARRHSPATA